MLYSHHHPDPHFASPHGPSEVGLTSGSHDFTDSQSPCRGRRRWRIQVWKCVGMMRYHSGRHPYGLEALYHVASAQLPRRWRDGGTATGRRDYAYIDVNPPNLYRWTHCLQSRGPEAEAGRALDHQSTRKGPPAGRLPMLRMRRACLPGACPF